MTYLFSSTFLPVSERRLLGFGIVNPRNAPAGPDKSPQGLAAKLEGLNATGLNSAEAKDLPTTVATELKNMAATRQVDAENRFKTAVGDAVQKEFDYELGEINKRTPPPSAVDAANEAAQKAMQDFNGMASITIDATTGAPSITVSIDGPAKGPRQAPRNRGEELTQKMEDAQKEFEDAMNAKPPDTMKQFSAAMKGLGAAFEFIKGSFDGSNDKAPQSGPNSASSGPGSNPNAPNKSAVRTKLRTELKTTAAGVLLTQKENKLGNDTTAGTEKFKLKAATDDVTNKEADVQTSKTKVEQLKKEKADLSDPANKDAKQRAIDAEQAVLTTAETALKTAQTNKTKLEKSVTELEAEIKELKEMQSGLDKSAKAVEATLKKLGETIGLFKNKYAQDLSATLKGITLWQNANTLDLELLNPAATLTSIKTNAAVLLHGSAVGAPALSDEDVGFTGVAGILVPEKFEAFGKRVEAALQAKVGPRKAEIAKEKSEHMDKLLEKIKDKKMMNDAPDRLSDDERAGILKAAATKNTWVTNGSSEFIVLDDVIVEQYLDGSAAYTYTEATGDMTGFENMTYNTVSRKFEDVPTKDDGSGNDIPDTDNNKYNAATRKWELK